MKHLLFIVGAICVLCFSRSQAQNWVTNGPKKINEVHDLTIGKSGGTQKIYAADEIHVRVTTNGGTNWDSTAGIMSSPLVIDCKSSSPDWVIAASIGNNVWQSTNGGSSWTNRSTTIDLVPLCLSINAASENVAFLGADTINRNGTWTTSLWKTLDGGANWTALNYFRDDARTNIRDIAYHPFNSSRVWVCGTAGSPHDLTVDYGEDLELESPTRYGLWYTSDGGTNWELRVQELPSTRNIMAMVLSVPNGTSDTMLYAALRTSTNGDARLYRSESFGENWDTYFEFVEGTKDVRVLKMKPGSVDTMVAATNMGFQISTTRGQSWKDQNGGLTELDVRQLVFDKNDHLTIYAATAGGVFKSTNCGETWAQQTVNTSIVNISSVAGQSNTLFTTSVISPVINTSTNAGGSWDLGTVIGARAFGGYHASINPNYSGYAYGGGDFTTDPSDIDAAIYTTTNTGGSWSLAFSLSSSHKLRFYQVVADPKKTSSRVYAVGKTSSSSSGKNFYYSTNKGVTWSSSQGATVRSSGGADTVLCLVADTTGAETNSQTIYVGLGSDLGVYRSVDGGGSWSARGLSGKTVRSLALKQSTAGTIYAGADEGFFKSADGGANWGSALRSDIVHRVLYHPSYSTSTNHLWVIADAGNKIFKTIDAGSNWTEITTSSLPKPLNDLRSDPANDSVIYVATSYGMFKINPEPEIPTGVAVGPSGGHPQVTWTVNAETDVTTGGNYLIDRRQRNHGGSWTSWSHVGTPSGSASSWSDNAITGGGSGPDTLQYRMRARDGQLNLSDYSSTVTMLYSSIIQKAAVGDVAEIPDDYQLFQNTPNPFNPSTVIKYALPDDAFVVLKVYDITGREVMTLVNDVQSAGYKAVTFNVIGFASGVYLYRLSASRFSDVKKMIVTK